ncbi:hypothetical protein IQ272_09165 [Chroococcidiopsidales cyanobacterium LEGE 13417]|nr:hypothetical protein [Chroococcidiopsidales cyanobacterium LEGE 13417]
MTTIETLNSTNELDFGKWISLKNVQIVPLEIEYFWSAFDNYLEFLKGFSGRDNVELETNAGKPADGPGAIVRFDFQGSLQVGKCLSPDERPHLVRLLAAHIRQFPHDQNAYSWIPDSSRQLKEKAIAPATRERLSIEEFDDR